MTGQLYVALSRVGSFDALKILIVPEDTEEVRKFLTDNPGVYTRNVVYREVLD